MGKDLKGCDRGECRLCSEAGDDCDEYVLHPDAKTTQVTSCRDCLHPQATHKKRTSPAEDLSNKSDTASAGQSEKKDDEKWKNKKLGFIAGFETCDDIFDSSTSRTKNTVVKELYKSKFSKGWSVMNHLDCESFKKNYVSPEYKRRIEIKRQLVKLQNKVEFNLSQNPNAVGYFTHPDIVLKPTDRDNLNKQLSKLNDVMGEIEAVRKTLREHENENTVVDTNGNRRPKSGLEPIIMFNNECHTKLIEMESELKEINTKIIPVKEKFDKNFAISAPRNRDKARASKENRRKAKKRKGDENVDDNASKRVAPDSDGQTVEIDSADEDGLASDEGFAGVDRQSGSGDSPAVYGLASDECFAGVDGSTGDGDSAGVDGLAGHEDSTSVIKDLLYGVVKKADTILKRKALQKFAYIPHEKDAMNNNT